MAQSKAKASKPVKNAPVAHGVGRRKSSVARIWLRRGNGVITVNKKEVSSYFDTLVDESTAKSTFRIVPISSQYDVHAIVKGGGKTAQADAIKLAIARSFVDIDETLRPLLRRNDLLTVDARKKERKKPGQKAARRKFQFVKR